MAACEEGLAFMKLVSYLLVVSRRIICAKFPSTCGVDEVFHE
jgi:hypothetical protein